MRGPTKSEILKTISPDLRTKSKSTKVYQEIRRKILTGDYQSEQVLIPKDIETEYHISNTGVQTVLLRLTMEGLVKVLRIKERTGPNNAAVNEYRVADLNIRHRMFSTRQGDFVSDISQGGHPAHKETLELTIEHADEEVAKLLNIRPGENVIFYQNLQKRDSNTIVCLNDHYLPFWFAEMIPELKKPDSDVYDLMRKLGKKPVWCTETVDVVQASSKERVMFDLSADDPSPLLKIIRRSFDIEGNPLDVQFLTDRGDMYRLHYSFPLYSDGVPKPLRGK